MRKIKLVGACMLASFFMVAAIGSGSSPTNSTSEITSVTNNSSESSSSTDSNDSSAVQEETQSATLMPTIEEEVVYDAGGIRITAKEYVSDSLFGDGIKFLIENDTDKNITVGTNAIIVNDYMITDFFVSDVAAGKKTNETLDLWSSELKEAGIENIGQVEIYFHIYDSDSWGDIANPDCVTIKTSLYDQMDTTVDDAGQVLYEEGGVKIVGKYVNESSFWGTAVMLYIENNSGRNVTVDVDNLSVNGFTMDLAIFSSTVYDGKKAYDDITLLSSDLEENDITSVDEISLTFKLIDPNSYNTIAESDEITFSTK